MGCGTGKFAVGNPENEHSGTSRGVIPPEKTPSFYGVASTNRVKTVTFDEDVENMQSHFPAEKAEPSSFNLNEPESVLRAVKYAVPTWCSLIDVADISICAVEGENDVVKVSLQHERIRSLEEEEGPTAVILKFRSQRRTSQLVPYLGEEAARQWGLCEPPIGPRTYHSGQPGILVMMFCDAGNLGPAFSQAFAQNQSDSEELGHVLGRLHSLDDTWYKPFEEKAYDEQLLLDEGLAHSQFSRLAAPSLIQALMWDSNSTVQATLLHSILQHPEARKYGVAGFELIAMCEGYRSSLLSEKAAARWCRKPEYRWELPPLPGLPAEMSEATAPLSAKFRQVMGDIMHLLIEQIVPRALALSEGRFMGRRVVGCGNLHAGSIGRHSKEPASLLLLDAERCMSMPALYDFGGLSAHGLIMGEKGGISLEHRRAIAQGYLDEMTKKAPAVVQQHSATATVEEVMFDIEKGSVLQMINMAMVTVLRSNGGRHENHLGGWAIWANTGYAKRATELFERAVDGSELKARIINEGIVAVVIQDSKKLHPWKNITAPQAEASEYWSQDFFGCVGAPEHWFPEAELPPAS